MNIHILKLNCIVFILVALSAYACSNKSTYPETEMPDIGVPEREINTRLRLSAPDGWNTFLIGDAVSLAVEVITNDQIAFPYDYGAKMYVNEENQWEEIGNFMKYPNGFLVLSSANGSKIKIGDAGVDPVLPETNKAVTLKVVLIGYFYRDGQITNDKTAAYIDIQLKPKSSE